MSKESKSENLSASLDSGFDELAEDDGIDLRQYWRIILRYKWGILALVIAVGLFTTILAASMPSVYRSTATLVIGGQESELASGGKKSQSSFDKEKFLRTQHEMFKSREVAKAALAHLGTYKASIISLLDENAKSKFILRNWIPQSWRERLPSPQPPVFDPDPDTQLLRWLENNLKIEPVPDTAMVNISFDSPEPELSARVANAVAKAYIDYNLKQRIESTTEVSQWLEDQLEISQKHVDESVDVLQKYREEAGLVADGSTMSNVQTEHLKILAAELTEAQKTRAHAEGIYERAKRLVGTGEMDTLPGVLNNPWIQRLREQEQDLEVQIRSDSERFQGDYPGLDDAKNNLETIRKQISGAHKELVGNFKTDYEIAMANERRLREDIVKLEANIQNLSRKQLDAESLEQVVLTNRQAHDAFLDQLTEISTRKADTVSLVARVVDAAVPDYRPVKSKKLVMVSMGVLLALMAGIGVAVTLDRFDTSLKSREDVEVRLGGVPVLGELVLLEGKREDGEHYNLSRQYLDEPKSVFAESVRTIRTGVALSGMDQSHQVLVVTSTVSGEGKSTVASNLALALGQLGKVLLIDADLRRPSLDKLCGEKSSTLGLVDLVAGTAKVMDCIREIPGDIHLLPAGSSIPSDPLEILSSDRFSEVLEKAATMYDTVVIDSAPVELVSDARMLATKVSGIVYVIKADDTPYQLVRQGLLGLSETGASLVGVVLNQLDPHKAHMYDKYTYGYSRYGSYSRYGYGYGESKQKASKRSEPDHIRSANVG